MKNLAKKLLYRDFTENECNHIATYYKNFGNRQLTFFIDNCGIVTVKAIEFYSDKLPVKMFEEKFQSEIKMPKRYIKCYIDRIKSAVL